MFSLKNMLQEGLDSMVTLKPEPRTEIWASDLGKSFADRFLNMKGTPYTNPSDGYSMQNFIIGSGVEKAFISQVEICMLHTNPDVKKVRIEREGCLPVVGRSDLLFEVPDWKVVEDKVDEYINSTVVPDFRKAKKVRLMEIIQRWKKLHPAGIPKTVYEIKSINSWALKYHKTDEALMYAYPHYLLQLVAYLIGHKLNEGGLIFIAKDAGKNYGFIREIPVRLTPKLEKMFWDDVEQFSKYFLANKQPPAEPISTDGKKINWKVRYSSYYDLLYKAEVERWEKMNKLKSMKGDLEELKQTFK